MPDEAQDLIATCLNGGNWFPYFRPWALLYGKLQALFVQDLMNRRDMPGVKLDEEGYFLCTEGFLQNPDLTVWTEKEQRGLFTALTRRGVLSVRKKGLPARRWVRVNLAVIVTDLKTWRNWSRPQGHNWLLPRGRTNKKEETLAVSSFLEKREPAAADAAARTPVEDPQVPEEDVPQLRTLMANALAKPSLKSAPSPFDQETADFVRKLCVEQGWVVARTHKKWWADQVRKLRQADAGPTSQQIATAVAGYAAAVTAGKTKFKITDCHQLRVQWHRVLDISQKMPPPASASAVEVARKASLQYKWPKVTSADVAGFAQRCISFGEDLCRRLAQLKKKLEDRLAGPKRTDEQKSQATRDRTLLGAVNALYVKVANPDYWTQKYLERILKEVRNWKEWSGDLSMYLPSLGSGKAGLKRAVLDAGCSESTWTRLKEALK